MAFKILLINQGAAMMINRLCALLGEAGIETAVVEPRATEIATAKDGVNAFVLFTGDFIYDAKAFLEYFKNMCLEAKIPLYVVGYDKELAKFEAEFPKDLITREIARPFDVNSLSAKLKSLFGVGPGTKGVENILLVDDDVSFLQTMQKWLKTKYNVTAVRSGRQAIEYLLTEHTVDLVLLDYDMPGMTGLQVLETIRYNPKILHVPVIFLTGKNDRDSVMSVIDLKPDGYILKSMSKEDILASLYRFFSAR